MQKEAQQLGFGGEFEPLNSKTGLNQTTEEQNSNRKLSDVPKNQLRLRDAFIETLDSPSLPSLNVEEKLDPDTEEILNTIPRLKFIKKDSQKKYSTEKGYVRLTFLNNSVLEKLNTTINNRIETIYVARTPIVIRKSTPFEVFTFTVRSGQRVFKCPRLTGVPKRLLPEMVEKLKANVK